MAEPFKNLLNADVVQTTARQIQFVWPAFDMAHFESLALAELENLEFKARADHLASALQATLPKEFDHAASIIEASLAAVTPDTDLSLLQSTQQQGLAGWIVWPLGEFVVRAGMDQPQRALQTLHALTQRFTAEFAIRPFIVNHADLVFEHLHQWKSDPSPHVRRLVSEGSRPRLPWGLRLHQLIKDPQPSLPLLLHLQDDPSDYVRRSVANHLNDIAKDHPDILVNWLQTHLPSASDLRRRLLRHASRTLIKNGHQEVLIAWGLGTEFEGSKDWSISPRQVHIGESLGINLQLQSQSSKTQTLEIDYAIHFCKANGDRTPKVFKGWKLTLQPGARIELQKRHAMKLITTRRYYAGAHAVEVQINGQSLGLQEFALTL